MKSDTFDVVILGSGPAGLQAAIHTSRRKASVLVVGRQQRSSIYNAWVENFCCLERTSTGSDLLSYGMKQAEGHGVRFLEEDVIKTEKTEKGFSIVTESDRKVEAKSLIIATGVSRKKLGVKGEREFLGSGVSYCVDCDAPLFTGKKVAVVGCGSAAGSGALVLTGYASEVYVICGLLDVDERLGRQVEAADIHLIDGEVKEIKGNSSVTHLLLKSEETIPVDGVFIELGSKGSLELVAGLGVILDENEFIITDKDQKTNVEGVYAAGDVCGPPFQVAKAIGQGCIAGLNSAGYAKKTP